MSRGFVKEPEPDAPPAPLPEIPVPPPPNPVTAPGLKRIEATIADLEARLADAATLDAGEGAEIRRKLRYWTARRTTAQITRPPESAAEVGFGSKVTLAWPGRGDVTIEIVGEDESDPAAGRIGWRAPTAAALLGNEKGDKVEARIGGRSVRLAILAVDNTGRS
ncbi:MAG: GreA/GreB family elongation factor [Acetobacteraceae bacterium]